MNYDALTAAAEAIAVATGRSDHEVAVVLGSGLSSYAATQPGATEVPFSEIPGFPVPRVEGHAGSLYSAELGGVRVMMLAGRVHAYEGWDMDDVVFGVRSAVLTGCSTVLLTNAAGSVNDSLRPGDLVTISDHLNLTGRNPLVGANDPRLGPRFPDLTSTYPRRLRELARVVASDANIDLKEGIYAWMLGPSYESPAEIRMIRTMGGDLVGMSTVPEAIAVHHMGGSVLAISLVTNMAAGLSPSPLSHEEVQDTAARTRQTFSSLLDGLLPALADSGG